MLTRSLPSPLAIAHLRVPTQIGYDTLLVALTWLLTLNLPAAPFEHRCISLILFAKTVR